jgi:hypothetical protein
MTKVPATTLALERAPKPLRLEPSWRAEKFATNAWNFAGAVRR